MRLAFGPVQELLREKWTLPWLAMDFEMLCPGWRARNYVNLYVIPVGNRIGITYEIMCDDAEEANAVQVVMDTSDGIEFHVEYPENWSGHTGAVVDFYLRIPSDTGIDLALQTVTGDIGLDGGSGTASITVVSGDATAEGFDGELNMNVVEGDIFFRDTPGLVSANLVNGSISGTFDSLLNDAEFAAVDGEIELTVPRDVHISVSTLSGDISIPGGNVVHEMVGSSADYGEGEFEISISTVSGDVEVTH